MESRSKAKHFLFWQKWLFWTSVVFAIMGLLIAFSGRELVLQPYDRMIANIFWNSISFPPEAEKFRDFIYGPLGATIACCYILLAFIAWFPFKEKQKWSRDAIIVSFGTWFIVDSSICLYSGVYSQVFIINLFSITIKALPIIFTWKDFNTGPSGNNELKKFTKYKIVKARTHPIKK